MAQINAQKVLLGGVVAGALINVGEWITHGLFLCQAWKDLAAAGMVNTEPAMILCFLSRFAIGILLVWLYAAARPRLGGNVNSALLMGVVGSLLVWGPMSLDMGLFSKYPAEIPMLTFLGGMVSGTVGAFVGAWLYTE